MSHGAKPVAALLLGLAVLLSAGIASACPGYSAQATGTSTTASGQTTASPRG